MFVCFDSVCGVLFLQTASAEESEDNTVTKEEKVQATKRAQSPPVNSLADCDLPVGMLL